jgi:hypothetical protein
MAVAVDPLNPDVCGTFFYNKIYPRFSQSTLSKITNFLLKAIEYVTLVLPFLN